MADGQIKVVSGSLKQAQNRIQSIARSKSVKQKANKLVALKPEVSQGSNADQTVLLCDELEDLADSIELALSNTASGLQAIQDGFEQTDKGVALNFTAT